MIPEATNHELLRRFKALGLLDEPWKARLRESAVPLHLKRGQVAFDEGSPCLAFTLITEGCVNVVKAAPTGREILLYRVEPGQTCVLTLNCLIENHKYPARGIAVTECYGAALPRAVFLEMMDTDRGIRSMIFQSLSSRIVELMGLVEEVAFNRLDERLARLLLSRSATAEDGSVQVTHQELADELGSVREIVSRILGSFADRGMVRLDRGWIQILDSEALKAISSSW
jgi:CRP/FNR family transcriptional regulator